jgi:hypothetical protein
MSMKHTHTRNASCCISHRKDASQLQQECLQGQRHAFAPSLRTSQQQQQQQQQQQRPGRQACPL